MMLQEYSDSRICVRTMIALRRRLRVLPCPRVSSCCPVLTWAATLPWCLPPGLRLCLFHSHPSSSRSSSALHLARCSDLALGTACRELAAEMGRQRARRRVRAIGSLRAGARRGQQPHWILPHEIHSITVLHEIHSITVLRTVARQSAKEATAGGSASSSAAAAAIMMGSHATAREVAPAVRVDPPASVTLGVMQSTPSAFSCARCTFAVSCCPRSSHTRPQRARRLRRRAR